MSEMLLKHFDLLATAPAGVTRLRELILTLAVQGKLVPQDPSDEPASALLQKIRAEKDRLIAEGKIKRDKPLAPIVDEEKPFGLPAGWEWVRIPHVTHSLGQGEPVEPFSYIDVAAIDNASGVIASDVQVMQPADAPSRARKSVEIGTVLYSTVRPYLKNIAVVEKAYHPKPIASTAFAVMHPHTGIHSKYLLHYLRSQPFTAFVNSKAVGVAYPAINDANFFQGVVPLPPTAEQSRIVTRVEELMRLCDALEAKGKLDAAQHTQLVQTLLGTLTDSASPEELAANWQRVAEHFDLLLDRPEAVDALEQTILQLAVRGLLVPQDPNDEPASVLLQKIRAEKDRLIAEGKIKRDKPLAPITDEEKPFGLPAGWEWVRMGVLVNSSEAGWSPSCTNTPRRNGLWGVLKVSAVSWGQFDPEANKELPAHLVPRQEYEVKGEDFLLSRANTEELVARSVVVESTPSMLMLSDKIIRLHISSLINRMFLNLGNNAVHSRMHYIAHASGTSSSMKNVSREVVLSLPVALPPLAEQSRIVARVEELRQLCSKLRQRLTVSRTTQAHLAEALVAGC